MERTRVATMPGCHHYVDEPAWPYLGEPPTAAEKATADRVDFIGGELERAALYPADVAWHISTALDSASNHGATPITGRQRDNFLQAIAGVRPAVVAALPQFSHARILDAFDALAELADLWASPARMPCEAVQAEECRARMRIGQNEAHNLSIMNDIVAGRMPATLQHLTRIAANEGENLALGADPAGRRRSGHKIAA